jgi:1-acyl-sn-glycerol-3-phosphate acyltransferase
MTGVASTTTPRHRHLRMLGADLVFRLPIVGEVARKGGLDAGHATRTPSAAVLGRARRGVARGVQGRRQAVQRALQAPALRARRLRLGRAAHRRPDRPVLDRRGRGDLPDHRQHPDLARLLGVPYFPITPTFPWLGPLGLVPLPSKWIIEFGEPIRPTTGTARPTTRCWSSTSPTRCARPSSRRSTPCSCSAARSSSDRAAPPGAHWAIVTLCIRSQGRTVVGIQAAGSGRRWCDSGGTTSRGQQRDGAARDPRCHRDPPA